MTREQIIREITNTKDYCNVGTVKRMYAEYRLEEYEQQIRADERAKIIEIIQSISENYATKLNAMDMYDEIMEQLKNHRF